MKPYLPVNKVIRENAGKNNLPSEVADAGIAA